MAGNVTGKRKSSTGKMAKMGKGGKGSTKAAAGEARAQFAKAPPIGNDKGTGKGQVRNRDEKAKAPKKPKKK